MEKSERIESRHLSFKKSKIIDRIAIFFIRTISNYYWIIIDILSHNNKKLADKYNKSIGNEYKKECKLLNISKGDKILHIGCGSYPLTEMTLANLFDINIVGIDKNERAVQRARKVIIKEKLQKKISINKGNGANYPVGSFDLIIVSGCALPKNAILTHIFKKAKKNCNIIIRDLEGAMEDTINCINAHKNIHLEREIYHPSPSRYLLGWNAFHVKKR